MCSSDSLRSRSFAATASLNSRTQPQVRVYHLWMIALFLFTGGALIVWIWVLITALVPQ